MRLLLLILLIIRPFTAFGYDQYLEAADLALIHKDYDKAIANYMKWMQYTPLKTKSYAWDDLGYAFLQKGDYEQAVVYLENYRSAHPEDYDSLFCLAVAFFLDNKPALAEQALTKIGDNIYFDDTWITALKDFHVKGHYGDVISAHVAGRMRSEKGVFIQKEGRLDTVQIDPDAFNECNTGIFYYIWGLVLKKLGNTQAAECKLSSANKAGYECSEGQEYKAGIQHRIKLHRTPLIWHIHERFFQKLKEGRIQEAIQALEQGLIVEQDSFVLNHNLSLMYFDTDEIKKAEIFCARALWIRINDTGCLDLMGSIYFKQGRYEEARWEFERIIALEIENAQAHYNLGHIQALLHQPGLAESSWKKALEYGKAPQKQPLSPKGETVFAITVKTKPIVFLSRHSMGKLYLDRRRFDDAVQELKQAISLNPDAPGPYIDLGNAYFHLGKLKEAKAVLEKYLYLGGEKSKEAQEILDKIIKAC